MEPSITKDDDARRRRSRRGWRIIDARRDRLAAKLFAESVELDGCRVFADRTPATNERPRRDHMIRVHHRWFRVSFVAAVVYSDAGWPSIINRTCRTMGCIRPDHIEVAPATWEEYAAQFVPATAGV